MKKWSLIILGILVGLVAFMYVVGAMLPREHVATRSAHFNQTPDKIWQAITDYKSFTSWRTGLKSVEPLRCLWPPPCATSACRALCGWLPSKPVSSTCCSNSGGGSPSA